MVSCLIASLLVAPSAFNWNAYGPFDPSVIRPEKVLGYGPGDQHTTYRDQERVVLALVNSAKSRMRLIEFGKSTEGRPLRIMAISTPENIARLESIRSDIAKLNDPEINGNYAELIKKTPTIVWINECIHGNESASFESGMWLAYTLAASRSSEVQSMLKNVIVIINPVYNPDGHERFVVWYNSIANGSFESGSIEQREPSVIYGRLNHYRFDMNRDRVAMSQAETRQEVAEYLRWNPQVYVDQHGQVDNYFFPPNPMAINANIDRTRINKWTNLIGKGNAKAFDKQGWSYYVRESFDLFYAGYLDSWTALSGAIGMTYETEGGSALSYLRDDGTLATLEEGMAKHFLAAFSTIKTAAENKDALLSSFLEFKKGAVSGKIAEKFQRVILTSKDPRPLQRFAEQLKLSGIRSGFATERFVQSNARSYWTGVSEEREFPAGSLIIDIAQPQGLLAKALLEPQPNFESEFVKQEMDRYKKMQGDEKYPSPGFPEFYDAAGWCMVYTHNLQAWWSDVAPKVETRTALAATAPKIEDGEIGWIVRYRDQDDLLAIFDLALAGVRCRFTPEEMKIDGQTFPRGTMYILKGRNEPDVRKKIEKASADRGVSFLDLNSSFPDSGRDAPGSEGSRAIATPKIGILFGSNENISDFSSIWYLMEKVFRLPFVSLSTSSLRSDLSKFTCIIVPSGSGATVSDKLKEWIRGGGCLISLGSPDWAIGETGLVNLSQFEPEKGKSLAGIPTSIFRAELDPRLFLGFGYSGSDEKIDVAVPFGGNDFWTAKKSGGGVIRFVNDKKAPKLLSGWTYGEETDEAMAGGVIAHDEPYGRGHVILFMQDPTERAMFPGLYKLVLNAMLFGPSK